MDPTRFEAAVTRKLVDDRREQCVEICGAWRREVDNSHAIAQRRRQRVDRIGGRQNDEEALGAIEAIKEAKLNMKDFPTAGIDGISDAIRAVKAGEMVSILQDAQAQAQGALDLAIYYAKKGDYKPESEIWAHYKDMPWDGGKDIVYNVPWAPVTTANADTPFSRRSKLGY